MEVILSESDEVVGCKPGVLVVAHHSGVVLANAGIDRSNLDADTEGERALLLPENSDASAAGLKLHLDEHYGTELGVVISDSVGRAWRNGTVGIALGTAGVPALRDFIGQRDLFGRPLEVTQTGFADELASAASPSDGTGRRGSTSGAHSRAHVEFTSAGCQIAPAAQGAGSLPVTRHSERPRACAVVPVKNLAAAKRRLAGVLSVHERRELSLQMLSDVVATLKRVDSLGCCRNPQQRS